ncbi:methyltransferase domain-containing protein [uncultured Desulfobacter sp.]|uniref:class I SAM-dependent methyltransferase n=1 Tax=uncultured Desulfobacter sp. TaxID=240139 RepID=UPI002AAA63D0|nr:methyltransferase domain-containing protein [uncultured Desulfobacter sp.]
MNDNAYINALEMSARLTERPIRKAIKSLELRKDAQILDVPCGIGNHMLWMLEAYPDVSITGVDIAQTHIEYAKSNLGKAGKTDSYRCLTGDINRLEFPDNTFDLVWCCDGLYPGPKEEGYLAEEPYEILKNMFRITKTGGTVALLLLSSQKLLPGYPFIETALNAADSAILPFTPAADPELHFMCAPAWMRKTGFVNIEARTFTADFQGPLTEQNKTDLSSIINMFWTPRVEAQVSRETWENFKRITDPASSRCILDNQDYTGMITYTMYSGVVEH